MSSFERPHPTPHPTPPAREISAAAAGPSVTPPADGPAHSRGARALPPELAALEGAVVDALRAVGREGDYTQAPLAEAVSALGRAAGRHGLLLDELLMLVEAVVRRTVPPRRGADTTEAVVVYAWRVARPAYHAARADARAGGRARSSHPPA